MARLAHSVGIVLSVLVCQLAALPPAGRLALDIRVHPDEGSLHPPVQLLIVDPSRLRCGVDPDSGESFGEIPEATYESERIDDDETGAEGPETRILYLGQTVAGEYRLLVSGVEPGTFLLEVRNFRDDDGPEQTFRIPGRIEPGEVREFVISVSRDGIRVTPPDGM